MVAPTFSLHCRGEWWHAKETASRRFPASEETFCHFVLRNNVFVGACCPDKDDIRNCTRRMSYLFLPFTFM